MKLVKPSFEIIDQNPGFKGLLQHIERCGRTCYKSEDKITDESAPKFVDMLVKRGHTAMVEHGTVYLQLNNTMGNTFPITCKYEKNKYSTVVTHEDRGDLSNRGIPYTTYNITTNYRVLLQNNWLDDLQYQCEPTEHHVKRITVKFICDIGISREFNRHRINSMAEMSTRYCNFGKDKFGNEISIIKPEWITDKELTFNEINNSTWDFGTYCNLIYQGRDVDEFSVIDYWMFANLACEFSYLHLLRLGWKPQQARNVLPLDLCTELVHTSTIEGWKHFFELRCANDAHPQARELAIPLHEEFKNRNYIQ